MQVGYTCRKKFSTNNLPIKKRQSAELATVRVSSTEGDFRVIFITPNLFQNVSSVAKRFTPNGIRLATKMKVSIGRIQVSPYPFRSISSVCFCFVLKR